MKITFSHAGAAHKGTAYREHYRLMADPRRHLLLFFCCGLHVYCCIHRTHAILGNARRASRERELFELRILHERQHLVHSERWRNGLSPNTDESSSFFRRPTRSLCARSSTPAHTCIVQSSRLRIHVRKVDPVRSGFKHLAKWSGSMSIQSGSVQCAFSVDTTNAHRMCI